MRTRIAAALALSALALIVGCSSSKPASGTETFTSGKVTSPKILNAKATVLPLTFSGQVHATGSITLSGPPPAKGQTHTFVTSAGKLVVLSTRKPAEKSSWLDAKLPTCLAANQTTVWYRVEGSKSTGKFAGASGTGVVQVTFVSNSELHGKCSLAQDAQPTTMTGAYAEFLGSGPMKLR